jgi:hypothetical protein
LADVGFLLYDLYRIGADNIFGDCDNLGENLTALGLDLGATFVPFVTGAGAASRAAREIDNSTELVQRWMTRAELDATQATGLVRGGRDGTHYVTDAANSSAQRARMRSALPQTPEVRVTMEVPAGTFSPPTRVEPNFGMPGGGMERTATGPVPTRVIKVDRKP